MSACDELDRLQQQNSTNRPLDVADSNREKFLNQYVDAFLKCHPEQLEQLLNSTANGEDPTPLAKVVTTELDRKNDEQLEIEVLDQLAAIAEKKRAVASGTEKENRSHTAADPIMLFNGQFVHDVTDLTINGAGIDFVFTRTYKNQVAFNGPLGFNWTHNFHIWLRVANETVFRCTGDLPLHR